MKKTLLLCGALLALTAGAAFAAGGLNLGWGDCGGTPGSDSRTFACNSNTLSGAIMVGSYITGASGVPAPANGIEGVLDVQTAAVTIPDWWRLLGAGSCRSGISANYDFTGGPFTCLAPWAVAASGGASVSWTSGPKQLRIKIVGAVGGADAAPLDPNTEYYGFKLTLLGAKSVGTGACAGCGVAACIVLNQVKITTVGAASDKVYIAPASRNHVNWQSEVAGCPGITPAKNSSWGQVKSMYRQ